MVDSAASESLDASADLDYRTIEPWALVGLVLGLLSPTALLAPVLWIVPVLGLLAGAKAMRNIRIEPARAGRAAALAGLALSAFFIALPLARAVSARLLLADQARPVADKFFEYLRQGSPEKAMMLNYLPDSRHPADEGLWVYYRNNDEARTDLLEFASRPPIRMLLALGEKAQVRFYRAATVGVAYDTAQVDYWYTITFTDEDGQKKTYIMGLLMERKATKDPQLNPWRVRDFAGGMKPAAT